MAYNNESRFGTNKPYPQSTTFDPYQSSGYTSNPYSNNDPINSNQYQPPTYANTIIQNKSPFKVERTTSANENNLQILLKYYTPEQRMKLKIQNEKKFNMNPSSQLYKFHPRILERIFYKYGNDFPMVLQQEVKKELDKYKSMKTFNTRIALLIIIYSVAFRRQKWFILTGHGTLRFGIAFMMFWNNMGVGVNQEEYMRQTVFANNAIYENIIKKFNIDINDKLKIQQLFS